MICNQEASSGQELDQKEILNIQEIYNALSNIINNLKEDNKDFYDMILDLIQNFKCEYLAKNSQAKDETDNMMLYILIDLYNLLLKKSFLNDQFLLTFYIKI